MCDGFEWVVLTFYSKWLHNGYINRSSEAIWQTEAQAREYAERVRCLHGVDSNVFQRLKQPQKPARSLPYLRYQRRAKWEGVAVIVGDRLFPQPKAIKPKS